MPRRALLFLLALVAAALPATPASARLDAVAPAAQLPPVTATTFVFSGRGWGHGVGMSQYGALGMANDGATYDAILTHFYTGVELGPAPVARVRVLVAEARAAVTLASAAPFRLRDALGATHQLPAGPLRLTRALEVELEGRRERLQGPLTVIPGRAPLEVGTPYRGQLVVSVVGGKLDVVNDVGLEQYLQGVVPREMPAAWPAEALKAQAVAARSYALARRVRGKHFDMYADVRSQVYGGIRGEDARANAAIAATAGEVMLFGGAVVDALFHSTSGGRTASAAEVFGADVPYLVPVDDPGSALSPVHRWGPVAVGDVVVRKGLRLATPVRALRLGRTSSGRVATAVVTTTAGERTVRGSELRSALGLRSTWITQLRTLSLTRPGGPVPHGGTVLLTAHAPGLRDVALAHRVGGAWQPVPTTSAAGKLTAKVKLTAPATFRLSAGSLGGPSLHVPVAPRVTARLAAERTVAGTASPVAPGTTVDLQLAGERGWFTVARTTTAADGSYSVAVADPGVYRARVAPVRPYAEGLSRPVRVP